MRGKFHPRNWFNGTKVGVYFLQNDKFWVKNVLKWADRKVLAAKWVDPIFKNNDDFLGEIFFLDYLKLFSDHSVLPVLR